jgi:anti-sigma regulatory factor (Ser/Thr protein kinase)
VPTVELRFSALPEHVRTARLVAVSLARRAGIDDETLDEVRLAVGEAATRAVGRHQEGCPDETVLVRMSDDDGRFVAEVIDSAPARSADGEVGAADLTEHATADTPGVDPLDEPLPEGIDLAVIGGLVDDVVVETGPTGSVVRMTWPAPATAGGSHPAFGQPFTSA